MESPTHSIVDAALKTLPAILPVLDFSTLKNDLFPVIAAVFSKTSSLGIKVRGLEAFAILCGWKEEAFAADGLNGMPGTTESQAKSSGNAVLDKYTIQEKVVPLLKAIKTKEPAVMMAALNVFRQVGKIADSDYLAIDVLPILWSFSLGPLLNLQQFGQFMGLIKSVSSQIEQEHSRKLKELTSSTANTSESRNREFSSSNVMDASGSTGKPGIGPETDFERLVLGNKSQASATSMLDADNGASIWVENHSSQSSNPQSSLAPIFQWSTAPSGAPSAHLPASRAITPDQNLSGFAALVPSTASSSFTTPAAAINGWNAQRAYSNPSVATLSSNSSPLTNMSGVQPIPSFGKPSAFSIPPPAQRDDLCTPSGTLAAFAIAPPPAQTGSSAGLRRYGAGLGGRETAVEGVIQTKRSQKQGLDAYESLL